MADLEDILKSLARRVLALDEDELVRLIPKYRKRMDNFTPNQEWEESVIIYFIINGYRVKSAQYTEELKGYMNRKRKDNNAWVPPVKPDIRQVLTRLSERPDQSPEAEPIEAGPTQTLDPRAQRPTLRLIRPKKKDA
ncbi:MAG: hypothetical protein LBR11_06490 [Deltaproteobacteria bacterium]|jgi:hypothetical protein|nr:hypothetical protein [Deltaproteobacteria bacterium]